MNAQVQARLLEINRRFYLDFGPAFAATRSRIQPGVQRILHSLPQSSRLLDLGCGSGALGLEIARQGRAGFYLGIDSSPALLAEARRATAAVNVPGLLIHYRWADLAGLHWFGELEPASFDTVLAFAVLHHLPGRNLRQSVLRQAHSLLAPGGRFIHSVWQFQHSPRLLERVLPWSAAGLDEAGLEPGDTLLDWRFHLPNQAASAEVGLRYVHLFTRSELSELAAESGFKIVSEFESDGKEGRLGLYQVWQAQHPNSA